MIRTYITESGTRYQVDPGNGLWRRNREPLQAAVWFTGVKPENAADHYDAATALERKTLETGRPPEVGDHLYVGNQDVWWFSTPVVRIADEGDSVE